MAQIKVSNLTFSYEGTADTVLEDVSFNLDTDWKLGMIGRNGKGKTTLLRLLMGEYQAEGSITASTRFDYFPYIVSEEDLSLTADELAGKWKPEVESWQVLVQMNQIGMDAECLYRPFGTLSFGERTRVMLAVLFAAENEFLLIDEPTNHLDREARDIVKDFLARKKGFILVSHDRDLLDHVCDHVLVLNRKTIEVQAGNFSSWWENKEKSDAFAEAENEKHKKEIGKLRAAADRSSRWADKNENTKIGFDPKKEPDRNISTRSYIGAKTKKMQARVKAYEKRIDREIEEKEGLLQDIERVNDLKLVPMQFHKEVLVHALNLSLRYEGAEEPLFTGLRFQIRRGRRVVLSGANGCGKSSIISAILKKAGYDKNNREIALATDQRRSASINDPRNRDTSEIRMFDEEKDEGQSKGEKLHSNLFISGTLDVAGGLIISYVDQDTSFLHGTLREFAKERGLDETLLLAVLRQLDMGREQFVKPMEDFSEGQKKKVLIAASLITPAHLYIWDEPLNYIDVFSRMQIEKLIREYQPTMLLVEHDVRFREQVDAEVVDVQ